MTEFKAKTHRDLTTEVAEKIIEMIEEDGTAWTRRWARLRPPLNAVDGYVYRGGNILTTMIKMLELETDDPRFIPKRYLFCKDPIGRVRKGEKSTRILYYGTGNKTDEATGENKKFRFGKLFCAWHVSQLDDLDESRILPLTEGKGDGQTFHVDEVASYVAATKARIENGLSDAFYSPRQDKIVMPPKEAFISSESVSAQEHYYSTLLHELVHWTGATHRLDRGLSTRFGSPSYAHEELIAELGSVILGISLGVQIQPRPDNAAYIKSWTKSLAANPQLIFGAAADASKAKDFLDDLQPQEQHQTA